MIRAWIVKKTYGWDDEDAEYELTLRRPDGYDESREIVFDFVEDKSIKELMGPDS